MGPYLAEFFGTCMLIIFGNGVVANVVLNKSKGQNSGWLVINFGWAMAVFIAVYCVAGQSGAHLNPAVSLALAAASKFDAGMLPGYIIAQILGGILGSCLVWAHYRDHYEATHDSGDILATFSTGPAINNKFQNLFSEMLTTFIFVLAILFIKGANPGLNSMDALPVALVVLAIGLSLGGPTGYAINPARDLGPRIAHAILPMSNKGSSQWSYAWIPVIGPCIGGVLAALLFQTLI